MGNNFATKRELISNLICYSVVYATHGLNRVEDKCLVQCESSFDISNSFMKKFNKHVKITGKHRETTNF